MVFGICPEFRDRASDRCFTHFPCLSDPGRRSSLCLKAALVIIHLIYLGVLVFVNSDDLLRTAKRDPWYVGLYLLLYVGTLVQYFITSGSSPGFVVDEVRAVNERDPLLRALPLSSKQPATHKSGGVVITIDRNQIGSSAATWTKLLMEMYPSGSSLRQLTCTYCDVLQPPRTKHCHDCNKCILKFDHHCVWLGTCIGQGNHCRFWWYLLEETALCLWTVILYIGDLKADISRSWWLYAAITIMLLVTLSITLVFLVLLLLFHSYLALTNQTTYELVRRKRIPYMRNIPERVYPFSKGMWSNLYNFCCAPKGIYKLEPLPSAQELEERNIPLKLSDVLCCRC